MENQEEHVTGAGGGAKEHVNLRRKGRYSFLRDKKRMNKYSLAVNRDWRNMSDTFKQFISLKYEVKSLAKDQWSGHSLKCWDQEKCFRACGGKWQVFHERLFKDTGQWHRVGQLVATKCCSDEGAKWRLRGADSGCVYSKEHLSQIHTEVPNEWVVGLIIKV